jgi:hypothetical protein
MGAGAEAAPVQGRVEVAGTPARDVDVRHLGDRRALGRRPAVASGEERGDRGRHVRAASGVPVRPVGEGGHDDALDRPEPGLREGGPQVGEGASRGDLVVHEHEAAGAADHVPGHGVGRFVDEVGGGVAVVLGEPRQQGRAEVVAGAGEVDRVVPPREAAPLAVDARAEADGRLGHAHDEDGSGKVARHLRREGREGPAHGGGGHRDVAAQHPGHDEEGPLRVHVHRDPARGQVGVQEAGAHDGTRFTADGGAMRERR